MFTGNIHKNLIFIVIAVGFILFWIYSSQLDKRGLKDVLKIECKGAIEKIQQNGSSIFFIVNGQSFIFGRVGTDLKLYAQNGDSLIKYRDSTFVELVKIDHINKIVKSRHRFEIY